MALGAGTLGLRRSDAMKRLLLIAMLATMLGGCIVVPAHPYYARPAASVFIY